ncbi:hypothetical protein ACM66B_003527 [Microbotryomycetes sp. NB124-2]
MSEREKRSFRACVPCRKAKTRCNGLQPCQRCLRQHIPASCLFATSKGSKGGAQLPSQRSHAVETSPEPADDAQSLPVILSQLRALERDQAKASTDLARLQKLVGKALVKSDPAAAALHGLDQHGTMANADAGGQRFARSDTPMSDVSESYANTLDAPDFVRDGLIPASIVPELVENYYKSIATRIAFLLPIPSFDKLPSKSLLRNTALTLALRTLAGQDVLDRFERCITRLGQVLHSVHDLPPPSTLEEHHDRVHAMALYSVFMSDFSLCRKTIIEAMDAGLHRSRAHLLTLLRSTCSNRESVSKEDMAKAMYHFDLWLSTLTVDNFLTLYLDVPPLVTMVDRHDAIELVHFMFKEGVATPWLVVAGAYSQMSSLVNIGQNDLALYRRGPQPLTAMDLSRLRTVLSLHDQWIERTTQSRDAERGSLPGLTIAAALGQLSCMRCCFEPVDPSVQHQRIDFLKRAVGASEHLMQTALNSDLYHKALRYSIEFVFYNSFALVHKFCVFAFKHIKDVYDFRNVLPSLKLFHDLMRANVCAPHGDDIVKRLNAMGRELDQVMEEYEAQSPRSSLSGVAMIPVGLPGSQFNNNGGQFISRSTIGPITTIGGVTASSTPSPAAVSTHAPASSVPVHHHNNTSLSSPHSDNLATTQTYQRMPPPPLAAPPQHQQSQLQQQQQPQPQQQTISLAPPSLEWNTGTFDFFSTSNLDLVIDSDWMTAAAGSNSAVNVGGTANEDDGVNNGGRTMFDDNAAAAMINGLARGNNSAFGFAFD